MTSPRIIDQKQLFYNLIYSSNDGTWYASWPWVQLPIFNFSIHSESWLISCPLFTIFFLLISTTIALKPRATFRSNVTNHGSNWALNIIARSIFHSYGDPFARGCNQRVCIINSLNIHTFLFLFFSVKNRKLCTLGETDGHPRLKLT